MDADHIMLADEAPGQEGESGHDDALAQAKEYWSTNDTHPIDDLLSRERQIVARGEYRDLVAALGQRRGQALDIDGEITFEWILDTNATWLGLDSNSGVLSGTPANADVGEYYVNVTVKDRRDGRDHQNFTLEVVNVNDAPEWLDAPSDTSVNEGEQFIFDANATDIDLGDELIFNITSDPITNITIVPKTGMIELWASIEFLEGPESSSVLIFQWLSR